MRIAHGLNLHRDGDGRAFSAFEAEMRRRLWWQIFVLDTRASDHRCSEPIILEGSFNTSMLCNLNDEDFEYASQHPLPQRKGITEMTFCLMSMELSNAGRKINFIPATSERQTLTLQQKEELVKSCTDRIETCYLAGCDPSEQSTWLVRMLGHLLILKLWLIIHHPLQSQESESQKYSRGQSLRTVVTVLTVADLIEENDSAAGFVWFFKTYVPWHALAVALAELCTETQGPLADRAWSIIDKGYKKWNERIAETKEDVLWHPVKILLKRAPAARLRDQRPVETGSQPPALDYLLQNTNLAGGIPNLNLSGDTNNPYCPMPVDDLALFDQTAGAFLD